MKPAFLCHGAVLLAAVAAISGCATDPGPVDSAREAAVANDPAAMQRIGVASEQAGDLSSAEAFYKRAADLRPGSAAEQIGLARTLAQQGRTDEAVHILEAAHSAHPSDTAATALLGRLLVVMHQPGAALLVFREGLAVTSDSPSLLIGAGVALDATGDHAAAQACYNQVLARDHGNVAAANDLALSIAISGQQAASAGMFEKLLPVAGDRDRGTIEANLALVRSLSVVRTQPLVRSQPQGPAAVSRAARQQSQPDPDTLAADGAISP